MRDGTRLAVDVFRPTQGGKAATDKLPVVWMHTPYNRRTTQNGLTAANYPGKALQLVKYGYAVAVADFRGTYASFGRNAGYNRGEWQDAARFDAYDITEWLATQPWSNGKVGHVGLFGHRRQPDAGAVHRAAEPEGDLSDELRVGRVCLRGGGRHHAARARPP